MISLSLLFLPYIIWGSSVSCVSGLSFLRREQHLNEALLAPRESLLESESVATVTLLDNKKAVICDQIPFNRDEKRPSIWDEACFQQVINDQYTVRVKATIKVLPIHLLKFSTGINNTEYEAIMWSIGEIEDDSGSPRNGHPLLGIFGGGGDWTWVSSEFRGGFDAAEKCKFQSWAHSGVIDRKSPFIPDENDPWTIIDGSGYPLKGVRVHQQIKTVLPISHVFLSTAAIVSPVMADTTCFPKTPGQLTITITLEKEMPKPVDTETLTDWSSPTLGDGSEFIVFPRNSETSKENECQLNASPTCSKPMVTMDSALKCAASYPKTCRVLITGRVIRNGNDSTGVKILHQKSFSYLPGFIIGKIGGNNSSKIRIVGIEMGISEYPLSGCEEGTLHLVRFMNDQRSMVIDMFTSETKIGRISFGQSQFVEVNGLVNGLLDSNSLWAVVAVPDAGMDLCRWYNPRLIFQPSLLIEVDINESVKMTNNDRSIINEKNQKSWTWTHITIETDIRSPDCFEMVPISKFGLSETSRLIAMLNDLKKKNSPNKKCPFRILAELKLPNKTELDFIPMIQSGNENVSNDLGKKIVSGISKSDHHLVFVPGLVLTLPETFVSLGIHELSYTIGKIDFKSVFKEDDLCSINGLHLFSMTPPQKDLKPFHFNIYQNVAQYIPTRILNSNGHVILYFGHTSANNDWISLDVPYIYRQESLEMILGFSSNQDKKTDCEKNFQQNQFLKDPLISVESLWLTGAELADPLDDILELKLPDRSYLRYEIEPQNCLPLSNREAYIDCSSLRTSNELKTCLRTIESSTCSVRITAIFRQTVTSVKYAISESANPIVVPTILIDPPFTTTLGLSTKFELKNLTMNNKFHSDDPTCGSVVNLIGALPNSINDGTVSGDELRFYSDIEIINKANRLLSIHVRSTQNHIDQTKFNRILITPKSNDHKCSWDTSSESITADIVVRSDRFWNKDYSTKNTTTTGKSPVLPRDSFVEDLLIKFSNQCVDNKTGGSAVQQGSMGECRRRYKTIDRRTVIKCIRDFWAKDCQVSIEAMETAKQSFWSDSLTLEKDLSRPPAVFDVVAFTLGKTNGNDKPKVSQMIDGGAIPIADWSELNYASSPILGVVPWVRKLQVSNTFTQFGFCGGSSSGQIILFDSMKSNWPDLTGVDRQVVLTNNGRMYHLDSSGTISFIDSGVKDHVSLTNAYNEFMIIPDHDKASGCDLNGRRSGVKIWIQYDIGIGKQKSVAQINTPPRRRREKKDRITQIVGGDDSADVMEWSSVSVISDWSNCKLLEGVDIGLFRSTYESPIDVDTVWSEFLVGKDPSCEITILTKLGPDESKYVNIIKDKIIPTISFNADNVSPSFLTLVGQGMRMYLTSIDLNIRPLLSSSSDCGEVGRVIMKISNGVKLELPIVEGKSFEDELILNYDLTDQLNADGLIVFLEVHPKDNSNKCDYDDMAYPIIKLTSILSREKKTLHDSEMGNFWSQKIYEISTSFNGNDISAAAPPPECTSEIYYAVDDLIQCAMIIPMDFDVRLILRMSLTIPPDPIEFIIPNTKIKQSAVKFEFSWTLPKGLQEIQIRGESFNFILAEIRVELIYPLDNELCNNNLELYHHPHSSNDGQYILIPGNWNGKDKFILTKPIFLSNTDQLVLVPRSNIECGKYIMTENYLPSLIFVSQNILNKNLDLITSSTAFKMEIDLSTDNCDLSICQKETQGPYTDMESLRECLRALTPKKTAQCSVTLSRTLKSIGKHIMPTKIGSVMVPAVMPDNLRFAPSIYGEPFSLTAISLSEIFTGGSECNNINFFITDASDLKKEIQTGGEPLNDLNKGSKSEMAKGKYKLSANKFIQLEQPKELPDVPLIYAYPIKSDPIKSGCKLAGSFDIVMKSETKLILKSPISQLGAPWIENESFDTSNNNDPAKAACVQNFPCTKMIVPSHWEDQLAQCQFIFQSRTAVGNNRCELPLLRILNYPPDYLDKSTMFVQGRSHLLTPVLIFNTTIDDKDPLRKLLGRKMMLTSLQFSGGYSDPECNSFIELYRTGSFISSDVREISEGIDLGIGLNFLQKEFEPIEILPDQNTIYLNPPPATTNGHHCQWKSGPNGVNVILSGYRQAPDSVSLVSIHGREPMGVPTVPPMPTPVDPLSSDGRPFVVWTISGCLNIPVSCRTGLDLKTLTSCVHTVQISGEVCTVVIEARAVWNNLVKPVTVKTQIKDGMSIEEDLVLLSLRSAFDEGGAKISEVTFGGEPLTLRWLNVGHHFNENGCANQIGEALIGWPEDSVESDVREHLIANPFSVKSTRRQKLKVFRKSSTNSEIQRQFSAKLDPVFDFILIGDIINKTNLNNTTPIICKTKSPTTTAMAMFDVSFDNSFAQKLSIPFYSIPAVNDWIMNYEVDSLDKTIKLSKICEEANSFDSVEKCLSGMSDDANQNVIVTMTAENLHSIAGYKTNEKLNSVSPIFTIGNYQLEDELRPIVKGFGLNDEVYLTDITFGEFSESGKNCDHAELLLGLLDGEKNIPIFSDMKGSFTKLDMRIHIKFQTGNEPKLILNKPNVIALSFTDSNCKWTGTSVRIVMKSKPNLSHFPFQSPWLTRLNYSPRYRLINQSAECRRTSKFQSDHQPSDSDSSTLSFEQFQIYTESMRSPHCIIETEMSLISNDHIHGINYEVDMNKILMAVVDRKHISAADNSDAGEDGYQLIGVQFIKPVNNCKLELLSIKEVNNIDEKLDDHFGVVFGFDFGTSELTFSKPIDIDWSYRLGLIGHFSGQNCDWKSNGIIWKFKKSIYLNLLPTPFDLKDDWHQTYSMRVDKSDGRKLCETHDLSSEELASCAWAYSDHKGELTSEIILNSSTGFSGLINHQGTISPTIVSGLNQYGHWIYDVMVNNGMFIIKQIGFSGLGCPPSTQVDSIRFLLKPDDISKNIGEIADPPLDENRTIQDYHLAGFAFPNRNNVNGLIYANLQPSVTQSSSCVWIKTSQVHMSLKYPLSFHRPALLPSSADRALILRWSFVTYGGCKKRPTRCSTRPLRTLEEVTHCLKAIRTKECTVDVSLRILWTARINSPGPLPTKQLSGPENDESKIVYSSLMIPSKDKIGVDVTNDKMLGQVPFKLVQFHLPVVRGVHCLEKSGRLYQLRNYTKIRTGHDGIDLNLLNRITDEEINFSQLTSLKTPIKLRPNEPVLVVKSHLGTLCTKDGLMDLPELTFSAKGINNSLRIENIIQSQDSWIRKFRFNNINCTAYDYNELLVKCFPKTIPKQLTKLTITATLPDISLEPVTFKTDQVMHQVPAVILGRLNDDVKNFLSDPLDGSEYIELKQLIFDGIFLNNNHHAISLREIKNIQKKTDEKIIFNDQSLLPASKRPLFSAKSNRIVLGPSAQDSQHLGHRLSVGRPVGFVVVPMMNTSVPLTWSGGSVKLIMETIVMGGARGSSSTTASSLKAESTKDHSNVRSSGYGLVRIFDLIGLTCVLFLLN